jgi:hypothetical protein
MKMLVRNEVFDDHLKRKGWSLKFYFEALAMQDIAQQYHAKEKDRETIEAEMKRVANENNRY